VEALIARDAVPCWSLMMWATLDAPVRVATVVPPMV
jgi:hypothetical protein